MRIKYAILKELANIAQDTKKNFKYFVQENNSRKVKHNDQICDSCVRSNARVIGSMRVPMRARAIARIKRRRLVTVL